MCGCWRVPDSSTNERGEKKEKGWVVRVIVTVVVNSGYITVACHVLLSIEFWWVLRFKLSIVACKYVCVLWQMVVVGCQKARP